MLGSTSLLLKDDGSGAKASYAYTPYGSLDEDASSGDDEAAGKKYDPINPYRYTGKRYDSGTTELDMGARRFAPSSASFLQRDQYMGALSDLSLSMDPLNQNRYSLAGGNPLSFVETDGHTANIPSDGCADCHAGEVGGGVSGSDDLVAKDPVDSGGNDSKERSTTAAGHFSTNPDFYDGGEGGRSTDNGDTDFEDMMDALVDTAYKVGIDCERIQPGRHCVNDQFMIEASREYAGLIDAGQFTPAENVRGGATRVFPPSTHIEGNSGWKRGLADDRSPARHFIGWMALGYFHPRQAKIGVAFAEQPGRGSVQDLRSGRIAISLGSRLRRGEISLEELLGKIPARVENPSNTQGFTPTPQDTTWGQTLGGYLPREEELLPFWP